MILLFKKNQAALATGNRKLQEAMKVKLFATLSSMDIREFMGKEENGIIKIGSFKFTPSEMRTALAAKEVQEAEENKIFSTTVLAVSGLKTLVLSLDDRVTTYAAVLNPELANPSMSDLPIDMQTQLLDTELKTIALDPLKHLPGMALESAAIFKAQIAILDERIEEVITNNYPEAQQPAVREFAAKGRIDNAENAANYIAASIGNPNLLDQSFELGFAWRALSTAFEPISTDIIASITITGIGEIPITKGRRPEAVRIQQAVKESGAKDLYTAQMFQSLLRDSLVGMSQEVGEEEAQVESVLAQFLNPRTGNLGNLFFKEGETGRVFTNSLFLEETARATEMARKVGILGADEDFASMILDTMTMRLREKIMAVFQNSLNAAAFNTVVLGNRPIESIANAIAAIEGNIPLSLQNARELNRQLEQSLRMQEVQPRGQRPSISPSVETVPIPGRTGRGPVQ